MHGRMIVDDYFWLRDQENPYTINFPKYGDLTSPEEIILDDQSRRMLNFIARYYYKFVACFFTINDFNDLTQVFIEQVGASCFQII
jgi:hypothetical protein